MIRHTITHGICPQYRDVLTYAIAQGYTLPSIAQQKIANSIIDYLVQRSQWSSVFETFCLEANDGSRQMGKINYINPGTFNLTEIGSPTWVSNQGFSNDATGANRISLTFIPSVNASAKFTRRDHSLIAWRYINTYDNIAGVICSRSSSVDASLFGTNNPSTGLAAMRVFDVSGDSIVGAAPAQYNGLFHYARKDSGTDETLGGDTQSIYQQGIFTGSSNISFANSNGRFLPSMPYVQAARYTAGGIVDKSDTSPISFTAIGHGTLSNAADIYKALNFYMTNL